MTVAPTPQLRRPRSPSGPCRLPGLLLVASCVLLAPLPGCDDAQDAAPNTATCPNDLPADGSGCTEGQLGLECTYVYVDDEAHCELDYRAACEGAAGPAVWVVTGGCVAGGGGAGGQGGGAGAGGTGGAGGTQ